MVNGTFISTGQLQKDVAGTIQFAVKNIGTKTSGDWTFTAELPLGQEYVSAKQTPLKPNERALLTITFPAVTDTKLQRFGLQTSTTGDVVSKNNSFSWSTVVIQ